ncbi:MAG: hypothetical protein GX359_06420 [Clostridiales bacterium]|nr:hypothetical protein [Clostridiales bacterium]
MLSKFNTYEIISFFVSIIIITVIIIGTIFKPYIIGENNDISEKSRSKKIVDTMLTEILFLMTFLLVSIDLYKPSLLNNLFGSEFYINDFYQSGLFTLITMILIASFVFLFMFIFSCITIKNETTKYKISKTMGDFGYLMNAQQATFIISLITIIFVLLIKDAKNNKPIIYKWLVILLGKFIWLDGLNNEAFITLINQFRLTNIVANGLCIILVSFGYVVAMCNSIIVTSISNGIMAAALVSSVILFVIGIVYIIMRKKVDKKSS